jgi:adenosine kinase
MCTDLAAANEYKIDHLKSPEIWKLVQQAKVYFVGGYHLTVCVPAILALAEEAAKEDKVFIMSLSAPFIPLFFKDQLAQTSKYWDYVIGNETEARSWAEGQGHQTRDVKEIALMMAGLPKENSKRKRTVIFTQGTEGTVVAVQGEKEVKEFGIKEIGKEEICDTNGAG